MKIALLALLLAGQAFAAAPTTPPRASIAPAYLQEATPAFGETFALTPSPAPAALRRVRAGSNALQAFSGPQYVTICDKARAFCDRGSAYWCAYEEAHCMDR